MFQEYKAQLNFKKFEKPWLLIQVCCAPDLIVPLQRLKEYFKLYLYWYNPNIQPYSEYQKRYKEYIKLLNLEKWDYEIIEDKYENREFYKKLFENRKIVGIENDDYKSLMKEFSQMEEKNSLRCDICYYTRLLEPAKIAKKLWIKYFTTTLLISPKKSVEKLDKYGQLVTEQTWVQYLSFDFRKNDWFNLAAKYTKENNIWRQNYCGCAWSIRN